MATLYDISEPIEPATAVFPGDTPFTAEWVARLERGDSCNVSTIRMSAHCGSHADSPLHYVTGGSDIASVPLDVYLGRCLVLEVCGAGRPSVVDLRGLRDLPAGVERVLLRTRRTHDHTRFDPEFTALGPEAARSLVAAGVRLIGIDTPSMDHAASKDLAAHHVLAAGRVALLENLDLSQVPIEAGGTEYELIALPLRIVGGDSAPVRAVLRSLDRPPLPPAPSPRHP